jgi:hypothetical protein
MTERTGFAVVTQNTNLKNQYVSVNTFTKNVLITAGTMPAKCMDTGPRLKKIVAGCSPI